MIVRGRYVLLALGLAALVNLPEVPGRAADAPLDSVARPAPSTPPRSWDFAVLPFVYYQPETSVGAAAELMLVRTASSGGGGEERHDTLSASFTATLRHQYAVSLDGTKYWNQDRDRVTGELAAERLPNVFWGLGNDTPASAADHYTPLLAGFQAHYVHRVIERVFLGLNVGSGYYRVESFAPGGAVAEYLGTSGREGWLVGIGPSLMRDSRDDSNSPRNGSFTTVTFTASRPAWGSDYRFTDFEVDQRTFIGLPWRTVLAGQLYGQIVGGAPPIEFLPALGGPGLLRGYFEGRYRDKVYTAVQAEWRAPLFWRFGVALFGGTGDVFPDVDHVSYGHLKESGGLGIRFNASHTNPINVRLDGAIAPGASGVYLVLGEAI
jgi:outer membrane protein assembly factor BamA